MKYLALQKASMAEVKKCFAITQKNDQPMAIENSEKDDYAQIQVAKIPEFVPGVIVKIDVEEPFSNSKQIRVSWIFSYFLTFSMLRLCMMCHFFSHRVN